MRYILTDIDETVLQWEQSFIAWAIKEYSELSHCKTYREIRALSPSEYFYGGEFNASSAFINIPAFQDSLDILPKLANDFKFVAVTACGSGFKVPRVQNLENLFPNLFEEIYCIELGESKMDILNRYPGCIFVDDHISHCTESSNANFETYMIRNKEYTDHPLYVKDWYTIYQQII